MIGIVPIQNAIVSFCMVMLLLITDYVTWVSPFARWPVKRFLIFLIFDFAVFLVWIIVLAPVRFTVFNGGWWRSKDSF